MALQESATYEVRIMFSTEEGELPTNDKLEHLIYNRLTLFGMLSVETGLQCDSVEIRKNLTTEDQ